MTKPAGVQGEGKCGGCAPTAHELIRGDLPDMAVWVRGAGTSRADWSTKVQAHRELPLGASETGSGAAASTAPRAAMRGVIGQKSAEAIVAAGRGEGPNTNAQGGAVSHSRAVP